MNNKTQLIIKKLIELYIVEKHPIGSIVLAIVLNIGASTIRNEMQLLDKEGFIESKGALGRVPTDKALRYYYNNFTEEEKDEESLYLEIEIKQLALSKIDTISFVQVDKERCLLTILFSNNEIINSILYLKNNTSMNVIKINEILKKTFQSKSIKNIDKTTILKRYEKNDFYIDLDTIFNFIYKIKDFKVDIINLETIYFINKDLLELLKNDIIVEKMFSLQNSLFFGKTEHNIDIFEDFILLKTNNKIKFFPKTTNYNFLKYNEKRSDIEKENN